MILKHNNAEGNAVLFKNLYRIQKLFLVYFDTNNIVLKP